MGTANNRKIKNKRAFLKGLLIFELIFCYMAALNIVSHLRGPQNYETAEVLATATDFVSFSGESAEGESLIFENQTEGTVVGCSTRLSLENIERIRVSYRIDCPAEYVGGTLYNDLYDYDSGYDNPEQEYQLILQQGQNDVAFVLEPGDAAPETAELRIFTPSAASCAVAEIQVYSEIPLPKVTPAMLATAFAGLAAMVVTAAVRSRCNKE